MSGVKFRFVTEADTETLLEIYRPYVDNTSVTLEYDVPSVGEFGKRIREFSAEFPYLVCEADGKIAGYAYAHRYKQRYGYRFCAELTVYLETGFRRKGLGCRLYGALIELIGMMGYKNIYGVIVDSNSASFALHRKFGFVETGREHSAGYKFGEWHDVVIFEKIINSHESCKETAKWRDCPVTIGELEPSAVSEVLHRAAGGMQIF